MESRNRITKYVLTAVFAAMVFVATIVLQISIPATGGYINLGDVVIILAAWTLGGVFGGVAGGIGAGLVDLIMFPVYAPATVVIKFIMGLVAGLIMRRGQTKKAKIIATALGTFVCEAIMILGYLIYEGIILGLGKAAVIGIAGNAIQGGVSVVVGLALVSILYKTKLNKFIDR